MMKSSKKIFFQSIFILSLLGGFFFHAKEVHALCHPWPATEWKCEDSSEGTKIMRRECIKIICWTETGPVVVASECGPGYPVAICNPWERCYGPSDWLWLPIVDFFFPRCEYDPAKASEWIKKIKNEIEISEKDITLWDGRGKVGEDENGNILPVNLPVKIRWVTKIPGPVGLGLDCGPEGFMFDIKGVSGDGLFLLRRPLPLKEAFSEIVPLREYQSPYQNKLYDEVPFEYRTMVEEVAFKDEKIYDFCPQNPNNDDKTRDRYQLKEKWKKAFTQKDESSIKELSDFLVRFTHDDSLKQNERVVTLGHHSYYSPSTGMIAAGKGILSIRAAKATFEKIKRALWGRLDKNYVEHYHIDVFQRRKQIEYFIPFKECKETTNENSQIAKKLKELSQKYCSVRGGRPPNVSLAELKRDLEENSTTVAFLYSPSQDKYRNNDLISALGQLLIDLNPGPCKIKTKPFFNLPGFLPTAAFIEISYYREMFWGIVDSWTEPIGRKNILINPSPEPVGILVFRVFDPGYKRVTEGSTLTLTQDSSKIPFPDDPGFFSEKISWTIEQASSNGTLTSGKAKFVAFIERWVDPDWNGPDFLDVTRTLLGTHRLNYPLGSADFVDFQFCHQGELEAPIGVQIKTKYRGEILLTDFEKSNDGNIRAFVLDPEGEPLPKQKPSTGPPEKWKEIETTAYQEHEPKPCAFVTEPPPTILKETVSYTWPFVARSWQVSSGWKVIGDVRLPIYYVPQTSEIFAHGKIYSWLGRHPSDRKHRFAGQNTAEEHAKLDTAFLYQVELPTMGRIVAGRHFTKPVPPEYEIQLCNPIQSPSRLRWTLLTSGGIDELKNFFSQFASEAQDILNVLEDGKVKEKCVTPSFIHQLGQVPKEPKEWSGEILRGQDEKSVEECVKVLTQAIQREIDKKCPPNQEWIISTTDPTRMPASYVELQIDSRNDAYYAGKVDPLFSSEGHWVIRPPYPHELWWHDVKDAHFPAWPRVNGVEFRFANLDAYTTFPPHLKESSVVVSPWSQTWHFRLGGAYYKKEEVSSSSNTIGILHNLFSLRDLKKEIRLDPLLGNEPNLLEAETKNKQFIVNRNQSMIIPPVGRTLSLNILVKESVWKLGGIGQQYPMPLPRFLSQLRYRPVEAYQAEQRCAFQNFNFWQAWPALVYWRAKPLSNEGAIEPEHLLKRTLNDWYEKRREDKPSGISNIVFETIREYTLDNELYFYVLPCQDEWGKPGNCYGWLGFRRDEQDYKKIKLVYENWPDTVFKFRITGAPPTALAPGSSRFPGQNFAPQNLPPVKIPNKFIWEAKRGTARYLVEIAKGLIEEKEDVSLEAQNLEPQGLGERKFAPKLGENKVFLNFFKEEGPYTWTVRTCADYCDELEKDENPFNSEKLWCGKPSQPSYFYGCFLTPPEKPISPSLGQTFLPGEEVNFSWEPIECGNYPVYYELIVTYEIKDHRETKSHCVINTKVLHEFTQVPNYSSNIFDCLGTYRWTIRACVAQDQNLNPPSLACTEWTTGDWSKSWYFNILTERAAMGGGQRFEFCPQCRNLIPQNCQTPSPQNQCGLREIVQLIFNILNCLLWCISLVLLIILIGATGVILIMKASEFELLDRVKNAWKGYGIGLLIMFLAWSFLNLIFFALGWRRQIFGDWWNPFP